jgi:hypothetical protein
MNLQEANKNLKQKNIYLKILACHKSIAKVFWQVDREEFFTLLGLAWRNWALSGKTKSAWKIMTISKI